MAHSTDDAGGNRADVFPLDGVQQARLGPLYQGPMDPVHPCREWPTRHCPASYHGTCGERPCARFESDDDAPWLAEV